jgi:uncharacterized protein
MTARRTQSWTARLTGDGPATARSWAARSPRRGTILGGYAAVGALSATAAAALGHDPLACEGWLQAGGPAPVLISLGLGVCLGASTIAGTRALVRSAQWARALHAALRPGVDGAGDGMLLALAVASASGEELLFRGLLVPTTGIIASSLVFGALHQIRGQGRWAWMAWATLMGFLFAIIFKATGSLAGPVLAHAAVNHANLRFLRDNDPEPRPRTLGGLLNR